MGFSTFSNSKLDRYISRIYDGADQVQAIEFDKFLNRVLNHWLVASLDYSNTFLIKSGETGHFYFRRIIQRFLTCPGYIFFFYLQDANSINWTYLAGYGCLCTCLGVQTFVVMQQTYAIQIENLFYLQMLSALMNEPIKLKKTVGYSTFI